MAVGFGYIRDTEPTQVDWGQITKDARESIKGIEKDRQGRRDKIEEDQKEFTKMLMERPMGGGTKYQQLMGQYSTMVSKAMLDKLNQLKRGEITEQEWTTFRGTVNSGATAMIAGGKAYVAGYDTAAELAAGDGSALANYGNKKNQRLFSLDGVSSMIDPETGETTFFVLDEDGEKEVIDMALFLRRSVNEQTAFDTEGLITNMLNVKPNTFRDDLGGEVSGKLLIQVEKDGKKVVEFNEEYVRKQAAAAVQQNTHVFDILKKEVTGYEIQELPTQYYSLQTQEERDAYLAELQKDTSILYVDNNDNPLVSDAQRKEAEDYIVDTVESRSEFSKQAQPYEAQTLIDLDIEWREASIDATNAEANRAGKSRTLPAIRNYARSFFPPAGLTPENIESTIVSAFQNFDYRDITLTIAENGKATIQYKKPNADKPTTVNFNLSDDGAELQVLLGELLIRQRGFDQIIDDAIIAGALDDTKTLPGAD